MPRPKPIIIPGGAKFPFGGTETKGQVDIDLRPLFSFLERRKAIQSSGLSPEEAMGLTTEQIQESNLQRTQQQEQQEERTFALEKLTGGFPGRLVQPGQPALAGGRQGPVAPSNIIKAISTLAGQGLVTPQQIGTLTGLTPKPQPTTLEGILAEQVNKKELTVGEAKRQLKVLSPREAAFQDLLTDDEKKQVLLKPTTEITIDLEKGTKKDLEADIIEGERQIESLNEIESIFKPEFLTYQGEVKGALEKFADKAGFGTSTKFLEERAAWMVQAKSELLRYRKWVTGVAGGEKEFAEIAKAFADPEKNSPSQFIANLKQSRKWQKKVVNWNRETRAQGLSIANTPENLKTDKTKTQIKTIKFDAQGNRIQ
jgi:hypothetical protein